MRDPDAITEKRVEAALLDAIKLLRPLAPLWPREGSWSIISWGDVSKDPRDAFEGAVEFLTALLDPPACNSPVQHAATKILGVPTPILRAAALPALRLGHPAKRRGPRRGANLVRDRWIAAVITTICQRHALDPYRNQVSEHRHNGIAIVTEALCRLGIELAEPSVAAIYERHKVP